MARRPLSVAVVWHMHQPYYRDDAAGTFLLPWVRRRATKDYLHMLRILERHPGVRVTMNMVPSLLRQLEIYASGADADADRDLCLRDAAELTVAERRFLIDSALHNDHGRRVRLLAPMMTLLARLRGADAVTVAVPEIRDLQLWTLLAWIDSADILADPALRDLAERGGGYAEADKAVVDEHQLALLREVIPSYRAACARGQVEAMTSPLQHTILPLLIDQASARVATPTVALPDPPAAAPDDAAAQVHRGLAEFTRITGLTVRGMWPAECAVSPAAVELMARCGVHHAVSDEGVLAHTLGGLRPADVRSGGDLYAPHADSSGVLMVFRDSQLSNRIGFSYQSMEAAAAASDLISAMEAVAADGDGSSARLLTIALDGENFKDFYEENGTPFLDAFYTGLAASPALASCSVGGFLDEHGASARPMSRLWSGSWIGADLTTWIGEPAHTRAWDLVAAARAALLAAGGAETHPAATDELLIAEASDWFWWFSSHHDSGSDAAWDALFRTHLRNAYTAAGLGVPDAVDEPVHAGTMPVHTCEPLRAIDPPGSGDDEWNAAGIAAVGEVFGAMRPPPSSVGRILYGAGGGRLHLRFGDEMPRFERAIVDAGAMGRLVITQATRSVAVTVPASGAIEFAITLQEPGRSPERVPVTGTLSVVLATSPPALRVALCATECAPLAQVGSLGDEVADTARDAAALGHDVIVIVPHHREAAVGARPGLRIDRLVAHLGGREVVARVLQGRLPGTTIPVLSIDAPAFFDRDRVYGCGDDGERYLVFCALAAAVLRATAFAPDIVHGFEWQTAALLAAVTADGGPATVFSRAADSTGYVVTATEAAAAGVRDAGMDDVDLVELGSRIAAAQDERPRRGLLADVYGRALQTVPTPAV